jgi:hypothetical protein
MTKLTMASKCSSAIGRFDRHGGPPVQYKAHCPKQNVQGYSGSHWITALGNYLLRSAPAAARATGKQTIINKYTYKAGSFMVMAMRWYINVRIAQWRRSRALLEATGHCHWASIMSNNIKRTWLQQFFLMFFIVKTVGKGHVLMLRPLFLIGV